MKKSELAAAVEQYEAQLAVARAAVEDGDYAGAIRNAMSAWEHIGAAIKSEAENDSVPGSIEAIDIVVECAPPLMDSRSLRKLQDFLDENRRIARSGDGSAPKSLAAAWSRLWACHQLWSQIDEDPEMLQSSLVQRLGGTADTWRQILEAWNRMGLVRRTRDGSSYRLSMATRLGEIIRGKCPGCGHVEEAPKAMLLDPMTCPGCGDSTSFVLLVGN